MDGSILSYTAINPIDRMSRENSYNPLSCCMHFSLSTAALFACVRASDLVMITI